MAERPLSNLEKQGTIQAYELAWNVLRDYLVWQGIESLSGSRDTIREVFKRDLIADSGAWLSMLQDRNRTVHTYNKETANQILGQLQLVYADLFMAFRCEFQSLADDTFYSMENGDV